jgi:serine protease
MVSHNARPARWSFALAVAATLLSSVANPVSAAQPAAHGFIVKLREGVAQAPGGPSEQAAHAVARGQRLRDVIASAGLPAMQVRPVGGRFEHIDLGRALDAAEAEDLAARLRGRSEVEWVVPNEREHRLTTPSDPLFAADATGTGGQWWLFPAGGSNGNDIDLRRRGVAGVQTAWSTTYGSPSVVVAVLDTGITSHPDLDANVLPGRDFVSTVEYAGDGNGWDADPHDPGDGVTAADRAAHPTLFADCPETESSWHGTTIAGMLAGVVNNNQYGAALSWNGRVVPVRVAGKCGAEVADILDGMRWAAGLQVFTSKGAPLPLNPNPARIVNISFGGSSACNVAYQETIDELRSVGVVVVAAAGNENGAVVRPASCRGVLGVAALNRDGFKASYSNFGPSVAIATVGGDPREIGAWGMTLGDTGLIALGNTGVQSPGSPTWVRTAGTSFASPIVAGVVGLMLSVNPNLTADQLIAGVKASARPHVVSASIGTCSDQNPGRCVCTTTTCGAGILDAPQALAYAERPDSYVAPARTPENIDNADVSMAVALGVDLPPNAAAPSDTSSASGGGGAAGVVFGALLLAAIAALARVPRRRA